MSEKPMLGGCCVCLDERGWAENPLVYCDGQLCNVAVHQACYGIIKVPSGPWFCRKCESQERAAKVKCELCPHRDGALKRTDGGGWAHVVCALYIPEVTFGSVSSMEPVVLQKVPPERFNKTCYICEEESRSNKASMGACMTCAKQGCKGSFHVTCAQMTGLLCEEASGGNQTKYCGYCKAHLNKIKKTSSYKSLSCTKVYKLPTTSSSDELTSPERVHGLTASESTMKPGDIRYTKAGKKRSKSLEESLAVGYNETKQQYEAESIPSSTSSSSSACVTVSCSVNLSSTPPKSNSHALLQSSPVPVVSVEPLPDLMPGTGSMHLPTSKPGKQKQGTPSEETRSESKLPPEPPSMVSAPPQATQPPSIPATTVGAEVSGLTLSSLAEAASAISQSPVEDKDEKPSVKPPADRTQKKNKVSTKESGARKRNKADKKANKKSKKDHHSDSKNKKKEGTVKPHRPVPPSPSSTAGPADPGLPNFPRHSVVSLASMGMDRTETYEPHEIGENNKIITPDVSVDGVTALERLLEEQKRDTMEFFRDYGTTPDVAALVQTLYKVREENSQLQSAIDQMSRRRDQLLLIKTRVSGLRMNNMGSSSTTPTPQNNSTQQQSQAMVAPVQDAAVTYTMPPNQVPATQAGSYALQQVISYPEVPVYTSVTTH